MKKKAAPKTKAEKEGREALEEIICDRVKLLNNAGITDCRLGQKINDLLDATKPIAATVINKPGKSKSAKDADESTTDFIEVPDNTVQLNTTKLALQLKGYLVEKHDVKVEGLEDVLRRLDGGK